MTDDFDADDSDRVDQAIADYLLRVDRGEQVDRDEFISEHADLAQPLRTYFQHCAACERAIGDVELTETLLRPGSRLPVALGDYELIAELGRGGMGTVYKAVHMRLQRTVAVKVMAQRLLPESTAIERFHREIVATGSLRHDNLVLAHDAREVDGTHFLVMEFIDGCDLRRLLKETRRLSIADAAEIARQAAVGLAAIHSQGLVHRDVKPTNLMVTHEGTVKLLDLGLALVRDQSLAASEVTADGTTMGTADYMAPEQAQNAHEVDARADLYSLGCLLYFLVSGRAPFDTESHPSNTAKIQAHISETPLPITAHREDVPERLAELIHKLLAKDPDERPADATEVIERLRPIADAADLSRLLSERSTAKGLERSVAGVPTPRATNRQIPEQRQARRTRRIYWTLGFVAASVIAVTCVVWNHLATKSPVAQADAGSAFAADNGIQSLAKSNRQAPAPAINTLATADVEAFRVLASRDNGSFRPVEDLAPLQTGDHVRFSVRLHQPAYVQLLWIDAEGQQQELFPLDPEAGPQTNEPVTTVESPIPLDRGWPVEGNGGIETALLLISHEPVDHLDPDTFRTQLPANTRMTTVRRFIATRVRVAAADGQRSLGKTSHQVDDAVLQLLERIRTRADVVHAIVIPHNSP